MTALGTKSTCIFCAWPIEWGLRSNGTLAWLDSEWNEAGRHLCVKRLPESSKYKFDETYCFHLPAEIIDDLRSLEKELR